MAIIYDSEVDQKVHALLLGDTNLLEEKIRVNAKITCQVRTCQKEAAANSPFCEFHVSIIKDTDKLSDMKERIATAKPETTPLLGAGLILR